MDPATTTQAPNATYTSFGFEPFTAGNILNTDVYQFGDNFTAWRIETGGDIGIVNNGLQKLEQTALDLLSLQNHLDSDLQALRQKGQPRLDHQPVAGLAFSILSGPGSGVLIRSGLQRCFDSDCRDRAGRDRGIQARHGTE